MTIVAREQNTFLKGEIGPYLKDRTDHQINIQSAETIENALVLPHGGVQRRKGFENLYSFLSTVEDFKLTKFSFNREQEYALVFADGTLSIFRDKDLLVELDTDYENLSQLNFTQVGDALIIVHPDFPPHTLMRQGSDVNWVLSPIVFENKPFIRFATTGQIKPSGTSGTISVTGHDGYFFPSMVSGAEPISYRVNEGIFNITSPLKAAVSADAIFGNAGASDLASAYDDDLNESAFLGEAASSADTLFITYQFPTSANMTGAQIAFGNTGQYYVKLHMTATTSAALTDDNVIYFNPNENATAAIAKRIEFAEPQDGLVFTLVARRKFAKVTGIMLRLRYLDDGRSRPLSVSRFHLFDNTAVSATVTSAMTVATSARFFEEQAWSDARGYPRTATIFNQRLVFGGTKTRPSTLMASVVGDYFNFDDSTTDADKTWKFDISSTRVEEIRNLASIGNLHIFTSEGEWIATGDANKSITPTTIKVTKNSEYGNAEGVKVVAVDGELFFATANGKEIRAFDYSFATDKFESQNITILAHHLFTGSNTPYDLDYVQAIDNTQSNAVFVARRDGQLCVLTYDRAAEAQGWSRWNPADGLGKIKDVVSINSDLGNGVQTYLYALLEFNGSTHLVVHGEEEIYLDNFITRSATSATTVWNEDLSNWSQFTIDVIGLATDGNLIIEQGIQTDGDGNFVTQYPYTEVYIGAPYKTTITPNRMIVDAGEKTLRDKPVFLKKAIIGVQRGFVMLVNNFRKNFTLTPQRYDGQDRNAGFNGMHEISIKGRSKETSTTIVIDKPVPFTLTSLTIKGKINDLFARSR